MKLKILSVLFLTFAMQTQGKPLSTALNTEPNTLKLALNWKAEPQFGGFYQAQISEEFKKAGHEVKILEGGSGTPTIQMLTFGQVDVAIVSAEEILISNERNPNNQVIALFAVYQTNPQILMTKKDRGFKSIQELLSKPGIVSAQTGLTYVSYLKKKYPKSPVKWVPYLGGISGLMNEKDYSQQGFLTSEPLLAEKNGVTVSSFLIADEGFNPYTTVVAVRKADLLQKKNNYVSLVQAIRNGWATYLNDPKAANAHMATINKALDAETFKKSAEAQIPLIQPQGSATLGHMTTERWNALIKTLTELKVLKKKVKAEDAFQNL